MNLLAYALIAVGGLLSLFNWATLFATLRGKRFVSPVPLFGALLLGGGLALLPETRPYAGLALLADYGTLMLVIALPFLAFQLWSTARFNLVHSYVMNAPDRTVTIKLYRRQIAVITVTFDPPAPCNAHGARIGSFGLVGTWSPTDRGFTIDGYVETRRLVVTGDGGAYRTSELNYPSEQKYNYDSLDGLVVREER
jgi:hypothetical protein